MAAGKEYPIITVIGYFFVIKVPRFPVVPGKKNIRVWKKIYILLVFTLCFYMFRIYKIHSKKRELRELRELLRKICTKIWRFDGGCLMVTASFLFYHLLQEIQICLVWHFKGCIQTLKNGYEVIAVNGEKSAKALPLPRDSSFFVLDSTAPFAYLVETDKSGYKTVTRYRRDCNRGVD